MMSDNGEVAAEVELQHGTNGPCPVPRTSSNPAPVVIMPTADKTEGPGDGLPAHVGVIEPGGSFKQLLPSPVCNPSLDPCDSDSELRCCTREPFKYSQERMGWYMYDCGNSLYGGITGNLWIPLFLVALATEHALDGSPIPECADFANITCGSDDCRFDESGVRFNADCTTCVAGEGTVMWSAQSNQFEDYRVPNVPYLGFEINPVALASLSISIGVGCQAVSFISFGSMADYTSYRYWMLMLTSTVGQILCMSYIFMSNTSDYEIGGLFLILSQIFFGIAVVFYNAYLPILVDAHPRIQTARGILTAEDKQFREDHQDRMSTTGFMWGYGISVVFLIYNLAIQVGIDNVDNGRLADRICIFSCGLLWAGFSLITYRRLKIRPGPPIPKQTALTSAFAGWIRFGQLIREAGQYPRTFLFLFLYFFWSDTFNSIASIGVLFAQQQMCLSSAELAILLLEVLILSLLGNYGYLWIKIRFNFTGKFMLTLTLICYSFLALWGCLGLIPGSAVGFKGAWEIWVFGMVHGVNNGAVQSFGRSLFADLIPPQREAEFFALYEITDKGSSWLGPLVLSIISQSTGNLQPAFIYLAVMVQLSTTQPLCPLPSNHHCSLSIARPWTMYPPWLGLA